MRSTLSSARGTGDDPYVAVVWKPLSLGGFSRAISKLKQASHVSERHFCPPHMDRIQPLHQQDRTQGDPGPGVSPESEGGRRPTSHTFRGPLLFLLHSILFLNLDLRLQKDNFRLDVLINSRMTALNHWRPRERNNVTWENMLAVSRELSFPEAI